MFSRLWSWLKWGFQRDDTKRNHANGENELNVMPDDEINKKFAQFLNDMNLANDKQVRLRSLPLDRKRQMLLMQHSRACQETKAQFSTPQQFVDFLSNRSENSAPAEVLACVQSLRVTLTNNMMAWVREFGLPGMLVTLEVLNKATDNGFGRESDKIQHECLVCVVKFTKDTVGLTHFLKSESFHDAVAKCIDYRKSTLSACAVQILGALCFLNLTDCEPSIHGFEKVLDALTKLSEESKNKRFKPIVDCITQTDSEVLWGTCLQFVNSLLNQIEDVQLKCRLRNEILESGLQGHLELLKNVQLEIVKTHYRIFEESREDDAKDLDVQYSKTRLVPDSSDGCPSTTSDRTKNILQHLNHIKEGQNIQQAYCKIIDECVSQLLLLKSDDESTRTHLNAVLQSLLQDETQGKSDVAKHQLQGPLTEETETEWKSNVVQEMLDRDLIRSTKRLDVISSVKGETEVIVDSNEILKSERTLPEENIEAKPTSIVGSTDTDTVSVSEAKLTTGVGILDVDIVEPKPNIVQDDDTLMENSGGTDAKPIIIEEVLESDMIKNAEEAETNPTVVQDISVSDVTNGIEEAIIRDFSDPDMIENAEQAEANPIILEDKSEPNITKSSSGVLHSKISFTETEESKVNVTVVEKFLNFDTTNRTDEVLYSSSDDLIPPPLPKSTPPSLDEMNPFFWSPLENNNGSTIQSSFGK